MRILVLGGSGFVGSHVSDAFSLAGHTVTVADVRPSAWLRPDQEFYAVDICQQAAVEKCIENMDIVCNFAGIGDIAMANANPIASTQSNVLGNIHVLEACRKAQVQRYIFASSLYVYGQAGGLYRCSKQACELYIEEYQKMHALNATIVRYGSLYGPRADVHNALHRFIREALTTQKITYPGPASAVREYVHVEDAARLTVELLADTYAGENILISGPQRMQVHELFTMLEEMLGTKLHIEFTDDSDHAHYLHTPYNFTPYSFTAKPGKKITPSPSIDLGQGLLCIMQEIHGQLHADSLQHSL